MVLIERNSSCDGMRYVWKNCEWDGKKLINLIFHLIKAPQKFVWKIQFNERAPRTLVDEAAVYIIFPYRIISIAASLNRPRPQNVTKIGGSIRMANKLFRPIFSLSHDADDDDDGRT